MAFRSTLLLALCAVAFAACPNQCSGHGRCGDFDRCVCFRQQGLASPYRYGFTGPDCSQRACPLGRAFDVLSSSSPSLGPVVFKSKDRKTKDKLQATFIPAAQNQAFRDLKRSQKFVVRISTVLVDSNGPASPYGTFAWRFVEDEYYSQELNIETYVGSDKMLELSSGGVSTGVYVYWDKEKGSQDGDADNFFKTALLGAGDIYEFTLNWNEGQTFDSSDSNSAHQLMECSGRGRCDADSGKCLCLAGYMGEACQRTVCPNSCSGHGSCQTQLRFASEGLTENKDAYAGAYDAEQQYGCKCDKGYRGSDCTQMECPSGEDPLGVDGGAEGMDCSGRGLCDYTTAICKCFKGYYGERCESQTTLV